MTVPSTWIDQLAEGRQTLAQHAGRDGNIAITFHDRAKHPDRLAKLHQALCQTRNFPHFESFRAWGYENHSWLIANVYGLIALAAGEAAQTPYQHLWAQPFLDDKRTCVIKAISIHPEAVFDLTIHAEATRDGSTRIGPAPETALMLLEKDLVQAIERHAQPGYRILYDLAPGDRQLGRVRLRGASLGAAAAIAIRLACQEGYKTSDRMTAVLAAVGEDGETLEAVGGEHLKVPAAIRAGATRLILSRQHSLGALYDQLEVAHPGVEFYKCDTVTDALKRSVYYYIPAHRQACPVLDAYYQADSWDSKAHQEMRNQAELAFSIKGGAGIGKTSLYLRLLKEAKLQGWVVLDLNLKGFKRYHDVESLYRAIFENYRNILARLPEPIHIDWAFDPRSQLNFERFLETVLAHPLRPKLLLAYDSAEYLKDQNPGRALFANLRSIREQAARGEEGQPHPFQRVRYLIVTGIHPARLSPDADSSPFNTGTYMRIDWSRWTLPTISNLNDLYGRPLEEAALKKLNAWVGGNPLLIRTCLHGSTRPWPLPGNSLCANWQKMLDTHLQDLTAALNKYPASKIAFREALEKGHAERTQAQELEMMGLLQILTAANGLRVPPQHDPVAASCLLYAVYFKQFFQIGLSNEEEAFLEADRRSSSVT
jgi:hypothetical protein